MSEYLNINDKLKPLPHEGGLRHRKANRRFPADAMACRLFEENPAAKPLHNPEQE